MAGLSGDEYSNLRARVSELIDTMDNKRESAKAASVHNQSRAQWLLGEAAAYEDAADELRDFFKTLPQ